MPALEPHLVHVFSTFVAAGPQIRTVHLINALGERYRHTIVPCDGRTEAAELLRPGTRVEIASAPRKARGLGGLFSMARLLKSYSPMLLLTYNWGSLDAVLAARRLPGVALLHHEDGFNDDEAQRQKSRRVWARRFALKRAAKVIVPSARLFEIARASWHIPDSRVEWIPNGIDTARFCPGPRADGVRRQLQIPDEAWIVGAVGHLRPVKNFARLIEACAQVRPQAAGGRNLHLVLIGEGSERAKLEALARAHPPQGGAVHLIGHQSDLPEWYRGLDAFCLTSDSEQHPVALIEAMAAGLPFVATDVGDVRRVAPPEQHPYLIALGNSAPADIARALERLLSLGKDRSTLGHKNRARTLAEYSFDAMLQRYRTVYEALLRQG